MTFSFFLATRRCRNRSIDLNRPNPWRKMMIMAMMMSFSFSECFMEYVNIPLVKYLIAANLCPGGYIIHLG